MSPGETDGLLEHKGNFCRVHVEKEDGGRVRISFLRDDFLSIRHRSKLGVV